jgi:hypothetical protein
MAATVTVHSTPLTPRLVKCTGTVILPKTDPVARYPAGFQCASLKAAIGYFQAWRSGAGHEMTRVHCGTLRRSLAGEFVE